MILTLVKVALVSLLVSGATENVAPEVSDGFEVIGHVAALGAVGAGVGSVIGGELVVGSVTATAAEVGAVAGGVVGVGTGVHAVTQ